MCLTYWETSNSQLFLIFLQILGYVASEETKKFIFDGEVTLETIKVEILLFAFLYVGSVSCCVLLYMRVNYHRLLKCHLS